MFLSKRALSLFSYFIVIVNGVSIRGSGLQNTPFAFRQGTTVGESNRTIVLLGDSLINRPWQEHNLSSKIFSTLEPTSFGVMLINSGNNGEEIASILSRTQSVMTTYDPWGIILFWDSDCSNIDESLLTPAQVIALRANFSANVATTVRVITSAGVRLAVAGPELLGEGPIGLQPRFQNKTDMLNAYRNLTRQATTVVPNVPYIDMRAAFIQAIPWWWDLWGGWVTIEGEHPNENGAGIEAELFAEQLNSWFV